MNFEKKERKLCVQRTFQFVKAKNLFLVNCKFFQMQLKVTYLELPTEEQREDARRSVNSTKESVKKDVQHLIEWFEKQPHLPNYKEEHVLAHSLLVCQNSLEKTKRRIERLFTTKALHPETYYDRNPHGKELETQKNLAMYVPLRKLTPDGYRVSCLYLSDNLKEMSEFPPVDYFFKLNQLTLELMGKLDYAKGTILVHDGTNLTMSLVKLLSSHLPRMITLNQKVIPISFVKIYFFNVGAPAEIFLKIAKSVMKKKLAKRIEVLKNPTDICKVLPKEIIPREYGGDELPLSELKDLWYEDIKNNYDYFKFNETLAADLTKVPNNNATTELSGMVGSFRQISID